MSATNKKPAKKTLLAVQGIDSAYRSSFNRIAFALVTSPAQGRNQVTSFATCRESTYAAVKSYMDSQKTGNACDSVYKSVQGEIDTTRLRLLLHKDCSSAGVESAFKAAIFNGKAILNIYEKYAGWGLSKITTVKHSIKDHVWLLTGPKEWMSSPALLSMVMLILRVAANHGPFEVSNIKEAQKQWNNLTDGSRTDGDLNTYLRTSFKYFPMLLKNYKSLFTDSLQVAYSDPAGKGFGLYGGVHSVCQGISVNTRLDKAVKELANRQKL